MGLNQLPLLVLKNARGYISLLVAFLPHGVDNRMTLSHYCLLNSYQCLLFMEPIRKPDEKIQKYHFQHTTLSSHKEKSSEGQEASCILADYIWPSALYLSPQTSGSKEVHKHHSHRNLHINVYQHFSGNWLIFSFHVHKHLQSALETQKVKYLPLKFL